jgi:mannose-6-phosphate isomerase-like protein (cupin superfamily)
MRYLDAASAMEESARAGLIDDLRTAAPTLHWRQTYTHEAVGASFLEKYGWTAVVGSQGPIVSHEIWAGFLLLGPGLEYPVHHHEPEELYRVVSGNGLWKVGDGPWSPRGAGARIHNPPHQPHGMRADADAPLVIAFLVDMTEPFVSSFDTP